MNYFRVAICKGDYSGKVDLSKLSLIISANELYKKFSNQEMADKEKEKLPRIGVLKTHNL